MKNKNVNLNPQFTVVRIRPSDVISTSIDGPSSGQDFSNADDR